MHHSIVCISVHVCVFVCVCLCLFRYHKVAATVSGEGKDAALKDVRARLDELGAALGTSHMLTRGGIRHFAHLQAKARG